MIYYEKKFTHKKVSIIFMDLEKSNQLLGTNFYNSNKWHINPYSHYRYSPANYRITTFICEIKDHFYNFNRFNSKQASCKEEGALLGNPFGQISSANFFAASPGVIEICFL